MFHLHYNFYMKTCLCLPPSLLASLSSPSSSSSSPPPRGHKPVSKEEVLELYGGTHIPMHIMEHSPSFQNWKMVQFLDLFSIPEATLFADVMEVGAYVYRGTVYDVYLASFPGSPPRAHVYSVTFDPHEESLQLFVWVKGHAIDVHTQGRAWERG